MEFSSAEVRALRSVRDCLTWAGIAADLSAILEQRMGVASDEHCRVLAMASESDLQALFDGWLLNGLPVPFNVRSKLRLFCKAASHAFPTSDVAASQTARTSSAPGSLLGELGLVRLDAEMRRQMITQC